MANYLGNFRKLLRFEWINGCIVLSNQEIKEFYEIVKIGTPNMDRILKIF
ncbi:L,D-transpeptidase [Helicobacter valdiviensis]|nr:L,D-transpeptidase [Helicobacter valdiviensis]